MENLDDRDIEQVAKFFSAFAVLTRLKILNALRDRERNVGDLAAELGCSQANVSRHLGMLAQTGLIERTTRGTSAFYSIADPRIFHLCDLVCVQVGRHLADQAEAKSAFLRAMRTTRSPARKRTAKR